MSSFQAVRAVLRFTGAHKGGHGGTLDPFAEGVLPIALGEATKTLAHVLEGNKSYRCWIRLGSETDTDDCTGAITHQTSGPLPDLAEIHRVLPQFTGILDQQVPLYSAVHINGERAYRAARRGDRPEMPTRQVTVERLAIVGYTEDDGLQIDVTCSKGTYIRALARDIGRVLGCYGHVVRLVRTATLGFSLPDTLSLEQLAALAAEGELRSRLFPVDRMLDDIPALRLQDGDWEHIRQGRGIWLPEHVGNAEEILRLLTPDGTLVAMARLTDQVNAAGWHFCQPTRLFHCHTF
jgi:tRNA pseudouridine55 synthase